MGKTAGELLLRRIHEVVRAASLFEQFQTEQRFTLHIDNEPYMALVIESWPTTDPLQAEQRHILVAHYYTANGQQYPDPELVMTDCGFPIRLRQTLLGILETPVLWRDPETQQVMVNVRGKRDMAGLLRVWAKNIRYQGFAKAAARIVAADTPLQIGK